MSALLSIDGLSKRFGTVVTAEDISLQVAPGAALGVVGPNGAGKTTLLSLIAGVERPDAGTIVFDGRDITGLAAAERVKVGIARTFQIPRPFVDMTVFENVYIAAAAGGSVHGRAGYAVAVSALERTGLLHLAGDRAGRLRLLDRKRLELARALATGPKLLLLDEIAGGLSDQELPPLIDLVASLSQSGMTIIWIEHIVHALTKVADTLLCLAFGRILAAGSPSEVMNDPDVIEVYLGTTFEAEESPSAPA